MLYRLENLVQRFQARDILRIEELSIEKGRVIALLGPNGAGKTTLLEVLAFLQRPAAGELRLEGGAVRFGIREMTRLRQKVVLVQQHPILFSTTVFRNIAYPLALRNVPPQQRKTLVLALLETVDLTSFAKARAEKLSGGETQRVAIAMALACNPEVLLLDEPTANVDREHRGHIETLIQNINRTRGISVIFATHNLEQAARLSDRTIFLYNGRVTRASYENVLQGTLHADGPAGVRCRLNGGQWLKIEGVHPPGPARIAIAPEAIDILDDPGRPPAQGLIRGRLISLRLEGARVRALVDIGQPLNVLMPEKTLRSLGLRLGDPVHLSVPPGSIEILDDEATL